MNKLKYNEPEEINKRLEEIDNYASFMKEEKTKEFIEMWHKKGFKKVGIVELLFRLWLLRGSEKKDEILIEASDILNKLKGDGNVFAFISDLKLAPEKIIRKR